MFLYHLIFDTEKYTVYPGLADFLNLAAVMESEELMLYTIPDYYKEFQCTANYCEDTCCAGWQIVVDKKSLKKYKKVRGEFAEKLKSSINWRQSIFHQDEEKRCAFLDEDNLCEMYKHLGKKSLCKTCRTYPRHIEEFENVRDVMLSVSCPEVARILMGKMEPVQYKNYEKEGEEEYKEFDLLLYSQLADAREVLFSILQNRMLSLEVRIRLALAIGHDMQIRINRQELFSCGEVLEKYKKPAAINYVQEYMKGISGEERYEKVKFSFSIMEKMELLREDWYVLREETKRRLYEKEDAGEWIRITKEFYQWTKEHGQPWEIQKEQLMVYFVATYFCGAVYDGDVYSKVKLAARSIVLLEEILKARWLRNEKRYDEEDVVEIVYRYSREMEHSEDNVRIMES